MIVCDDGSSDLTGEIALRLGAVVIRHERNLGSGAALQSLLKEAKKLNADILVTLDSDGQDDSSQIPALVKPIEAGIAQVVLGSKFKLKNGLSDPQSGFRAYSKLAIKQLGNISGNDQDDFFYAIDKSGLNIYEVPISIASTSTTLTDDFEPFVSIIIPTRNEESNIGRCLASFVAQTYPKDKFEILIIDGLSKDRTLEIVDNYHEKLNLRVISNPRVNHVYAFNSGIQESKGEYFIIVSGHSFVEKDFIKQSVDTYHGISRFQPRIAAVGGSLEMISKNTIGRLVSCLYASPFQGQVASGDRKTHTSLTQ